jgi:hypothetical protein
MKALLNTIKRAILMYQIRSLETTIHGQNICLAVVDPLMQGQIIIARSMARKELARARSEYNATLPPGKRVIWGMA